MTIYLDFDGTVVEHFFPLMGTLNPGSIEVIKKLKDANHDIVLNTFRSDMQDGTLQLALDFINNQPGFHSNIITEHTDLKIAPSPWDWKYFERNSVVFIDDLSKGIPLKPNIVLSNGKMVDWPAIDKEFIEKNMYARVKKTG
ncbi:MAG: hypothetical protein ABIP35_08595 [Ginsengibacter sp.]